VGNFWSVEQCSAVDLVEPRDAFDKSLYALCNPVESHLVDRGSPAGPARARSTPSSTARPSCSSAPGGRAPTLSQDEWAHLRAGIAEREERFAAERAAKGIRVMGRKRILAQSAFDSPRTHAPRRLLSPRVACKTKWSRIAALQRNAEFLAEYRRAFERRRLGDVDVLFPAGTYRFAILGLVRVRATSPPR
jgi:putative transposase